MHVLPNTCWRRLCLLKRSRRGVLLVFRSAVVTFTKSALCSTFPGRLSFLVPPHLQIFTLVHALPVVQLQKQTNCSPTGPPSASPLFPQRLLHHQHHVTSFSFILAEFFSPVQTKLPWLFPKHLQTNIIFFFACKKTTVWLYWLGYLRLFACTA